MAAFGPTTSTSRSQNLSGLIEVPVRLCALEGSTAAQSPSTDDILLERLRFASNIWLSNGTSVTFRSALYPKPGSLDHLPKIVDLCWPGGLCPGNPGDVFDSSDSFGQASLNEFKVRIWACAFTWDTEYPDAEGILFVNVQNFVDQNGQPTPTAGLAPYVPFSLWYQPEYCNSPRLLRVEDLGTWAAVAEAPNLGNPAQTGAHELGHDLLLAHGDGLDNDCNSWPSPAPANCASTVPPSPGPRLYDRQCDPNERDTGVSLMSEGSGNNTITSYQAETAAAAALLVPGIAVNPNVLNWGEALNRTFLRTHSPNDIVGARISHDIRGHELTFTLTLFGPLEPGPATQYLLLADLDDNPRSGGTPSGFQMPTQFHGADLVLRVPVKGSYGKLYSEAEVWRFTGKRFSRLTDRRIRAHFRRQTLERTNNNLFDVVAVSVPDDSVGMLGKAMRIQAVSIDANGKILDGLPDAIGKGVSIPLTHSSVLPTCLSSHLVARPGETAIVSAGGLGPSREAEVFLGTIAVGSGKTNSEGNIKVSVRIPEHYFGNQVLSIHSLHTGLSATCSINVEY